jgi:hypothetical protein
LKTSFAVNTDHKNQSKQVQGSDRGNDDHEDSEDNSNSADEVDGSEVC